MLDNMKNKRGLFLPEIRLLLIMWYVSEYIHYVLWRAGQNLKVSYVFVYSN